MILSIEDFAHPARTFTLCETYCTIRKPEQCLPGMGNRFCSHKAIGATAVPTSPQQHRDPLIEANAYTWFRVYSVLMTDITLVVKLQSRTHCFMQEYI